MPLSLQVLFLFTFNFLDAVFTLYWVRNGYATEGNHLMASMLEMGDLPFLAFKLGMGAAAAVVLWKWRHKSLARYGIGLALFLYGGLMGIHFFTGLTAFGLISEATVNDLAGLTGNLLAVIL